MLENSKVLEFVRLAQSGDNHAKEVLLEENSPLIKSVIKRFINKGVEFDDLYQIGCVGFLKAIKNFKEGFDVKFSTYVVPMVIGEIKRFLRDDGSIKVSRALKTLNMQINRYIEEYEKDNFEKPTIEQISKKFNIEQQDVVLAMDSSKMPISIFSPIDDDGETLMVEKIEGDDDMNEKLINNITINDLINKLNKRDKKIIKMRFYFDKTQSEIAKELNISQVQVSRLENKILENLKRKLTY